MRSPNPFVGPRAYIKDEHLYGRDREVLHLTSRISADRVVLLISPSGAGKSSLINAALIPAMRERDFSVLGPCRVSTPLPERSKEDEPGEATLPAGYNPFVFSVLRALDDGKRTVEELAALTLPAYLEEKLDGDDDRDLLIIIDQFEEILTIDPLNLEAKEEFFRQLGQALQDPWVFLLVAAREDYLAALTHYAGLLPTRMKSTFRLELLKKADAEKAISCVARTVGGTLDDQVEDSAGLTEADREGVTIEEDAVNSLVANLSMVQVQLPDGTPKMRPGKYVEPVQLQVVCHRLWEEAAPEPGGHITLQQIEDHSDLDEALGQYYDDQVAKVAGAIGNEREIRDWIDHHLVSKDGVRLQVLKGSGESKGLSNDTIKALCETYLVRTEDRNEFKWYELAHDRMVKPVRERNSRWRDTHLSMLQRQARLWQEAGASPRSPLLLEGEDLARLRRDHHETIPFNEVDWAFEIACNELDRKRQEAEQRRLAARRRQQAITALLALVALAMSLLTLKSNISQRRAEYMKSEAEDSQRCGNWAKGEAEKSRDKAQTTRGRAQVMALLNAAAQVQDTDPRLGARFMMEVQEKAGTSLGGFARLDAVRFTRKILSHPLPFYTMPRSPAISRALYDPAGRVIYGLGSQGGVFQGDLHADHLKWSTKDRLPGPHSQPASQPARLQKNKAALASQPAPGSQPAPAGVLDLLQSPDGFRLLKKGPGPGDVILEHRSRLHGPGRGLAQLTHQSPVRQASLHRGGDAALIVCEDGSLWRWSAADGWKKGALLIQKRAGLNWADQQPGGPLIATAWDDNKIRIHSAKGKETAVLSGHKAPVQSVAYDDTGSYLLSASRDGSAREWRLQKGRGKRSQWKQARVFHYGKPLRHAAFNPDATSVVITADAGAVHIWKEEHGQLSRILKTSRPKAKAITRLALDASGKKILSVDSTGRAQVWDSESEAVLLSLKPSREDQKRGCRDLGEIHSAQFINKGGAILMAGPQGVSIFGAAGKCQAALSAKQAGGKLLAVRYRSKQRPPQFLSFSFIKENTVLKLWTLEDSSFQELRVVGTRKGRVLAAHIDPDGNTVATGWDDRRAWIWSLSLDTKARSWEVARLGSPITDVHITSDGEHVLTSSADGGAAIWPASGRGADPDLEISHPGRINSVAMSPDGRLLLTAGEDGTARLWNADASGRPLLLQHKAPVSSALFEGPDGEWIVTSTSNGAVKRWLVSWPDLMGLLDRRIRVEGYCASERERMVYLNEGQNEARGALLRCQKNRKERAKEERANKKRGLAKQDSSTEPQEKVFIDLVTIEPSRRLFSRFGHAMLRVTHGERSPQDALYHFGEALWNHPTEVVRQIAGGRPAFGLGRYTNDEVICKYERGQVRLINTQRLRLKQDQAQAIARELEQMFKCDKKLIKECKGSQYSFHLAGTATLQKPKDQGNFATRIRDLLDRHLDGKIRQQLAVKGHGMNFQSSRIILHEKYSDRLVMVLLLSLVGGRRYDQPVDLYQSLFLPERWQENLRDVKVAAPDGSGNKVRLLSDREEKKGQPSGSGQPAHGRSTTTWSAEKIFGPLMAIVLLAGLWAVLRFPRSPRAAGAWLCGWALISGLMGSLIYFFIFWSHAHEFRYNELALAFLPTDLLLLWPALGWLHSKRGRAGRLLWGYALFHALLLLLLLLGHLVGLFIQQPAIVPFFSGVGFVVLLGLLLRGHLDGQPTASPAQGSDQGLSG